MSFIKKDNPQDLYVLLEKMGSGSYGTVWKGKRMVDGQIFAIKIVRKTGSNSDSSDVLKEVNFLVSCDHPNVVKYHESYELEEELWVWKLVYCNETSSLHLFIDCYGVLWWWKCR